jgi:hypothetical protein
MLFIRRRYSESVGHNGFLGGHLKFFHYAAHVVASKCFSPLLFTTAEHDDVYEALMPPGMRRVERLTEADAYFVAGLDWLVLDNAGITTAGRPVVNLMQGFAHLTPGDSRRNFLTRPALRICVSAALHKAVQATGLANGPLAAIENGTDVKTEHAPKHNPGSVFIAGLKNAPLAREVAEMLAQHGVAARLQTQSLPREAFITCLREAEIAVLLPLAHEGFFLPALEAMALGCAVVIPHCEGTRSFCLPERTALAAEYTAEALVRAVLRLRAEPEFVQRLRGYGLRMAERHSLERERSLFLYFLRSYLRNL